MLQQSPQPDVSADDPELQLSPRFWLILLVAGAAAGLAGGSLMRLLFWIEHVAWHFHTGDFLSAVNAASDRRRILNLLLAGILVGGVGAWFGKIFGKAGGDAEGAIWFRFGQIPFFATISKALLAIVTVGLGTSLGRESPIKQAGGAIASALSRLGKLSNPQQQLLVACGVGAGMASAYNVPLGGALFASEVLIGSLALKKVLPALVASMVATATSWLLLPIVAGYSVREFNPSIAMLPWALLTGPIFGLVAVAMVRATAWAESKQPTGWWSPFVPIAVLTCLGVLSIPFPQLLGNGKDTVQWTLDHRFPLHLLIVLPILKLIATTACLRSGARGGLFTPTMMVGALLGGAFGNAWSRWFTGIDTASYAVVGASAVLASATRGPVSALVLVLELTRHVDATMVPMLLAVTSATVVAGRIESRSIYSARAKT